LMICFDWFFPESARTLALSGAEIIAHPANLVLPYCPVGMPIRCLENRVFAITANRIGTEERKKGKRFIYIGMSQIVSPEGTVLVRAPEEKEEFRTTEIDPSRARDKSINRYNNLFSDRRKDLYAL
ncbi:MAG: acyltransferase, partial [Nitrospirae bacterium]|nr:acyltransferase [Nitrospirota bacterium]